MSDMEGSAIKLFGKTIPFPVVVKHKEVVSLTEESCSGALTVSSGDVCARKAASFSDKSSVKKQELKRDYSEKEANAECKEGNSNETADDTKAPTTSSGNSEIPKTNSIGTENSSPKPSQSGEQSSETSTSQEKQPLKKPDKIIPCPRCNSMDTKFCYYNNYNVNQPRHFCKNCQRYWTAGGTMRNVPVGAGRRKNKSSSASHYRQITVSEALLASQVHGLGRNGSVLTFGSDSPLCESVTAMLSLSEKQVNIVQNGYQRPEKRAIVPSVGMKEANTDGRSSGCSISNSSDKGGNNCSPEVRMQKIPGFPTHVPYFPGPPWPCSWNSTMAPPTIRPPGFPVSFYSPPAYWGCTVPGSWNIAPPGLSSSGSTSPLGKHSRDGKIINASAHSSRESSKENERNLLVPKTLRIDDPSEAAKSSIWSTLGIKNDSKANPITKVGMFKVFDRNCSAGTSPALQANPAALSRSLKFHETT